MVETLKIAFVATVLGCCISLPLSLVAARNLNPAWLALVTRAVFAACRSLPSIVWAIFFVQCWRQRQGEHEGAERLHF